MGPFVLSIQAWEQLQGLGSLTLVCVCVFAWKQLGNTDLAAQAASEACSFQGLEVNKRACRRPKQAEVMASGFSQHKERLESRVTIDRREGNDANMNRADRGKLLHATVVYIEVNLY